MKQLAAGGTRHRAIGADQPQVEAQRLRDRQGELVPAPGSQHDLNAGFVRPTQGIQIGVGNLDLGVQERAINIDGDEANGALHDSILAAVRHRLVNDTISADTLWPCERQIVHKVSVSDGPFRV